MNLCTRMHFFQTGNVKDFKKMLQKIDIDPIWIQRIEIFYAINVCPDLWLMPFLFWDKTFCLWSWNLPFLIEHEMMTYNSYCYSALLCTSSSLLALWWDIIFLALFSFGWQGGRYVKCCFCAAELGLASSLVWPLLTALMFLKARAWRFNMTRKLYFRVPSVPLLTDDTP